MVSQRYIDLNNILSCELAAYPLSLFHPDRRTEIATGKACLNMLKNSIAVETSNMIWGQPTVIMVDVSALPWTIDWPTKGIVSTFVNLLKTWVGNKLRGSDVHLVLDRYYEYSTKSRAALG